MTWTNANAAALGDAYDDVVLGAESARASIQWTTTILEDVNDYLDNGFQEIELSTPAPVTPEVPPVTESRPELSRPETPDLPGSAATTFLSMTLLSLAGLFNFVL